MDADMSVDPIEIPRLVKAIGPSDVAIGSRSLTDSIVETDGVKRKVMGRAFNILVSNLTKMPFRDTQCGFKAFRTPLARVLFHLMRVQQFAFDVEVLSLARQLRMDIAEVPVSWREVGQSKVRILVDPLSMTRDVVSASRRRDWPNVPALAVTPGPGERRRSPSRIVGELHKALGPNYPMVMLSEDQLLVLLPLCDPVFVHETAGRLRQLETMVTVRERSVTFQQLMDVAPFKWIDGEEDGLVVAFQDGAKILTTHKPIEGWESVRSDRPNPLRSRLHA